MKKWLVLGIVLMLVIGLTTFFWLKNKQQIKSPNLVYNVFSEQWEESYTSPILSIEELNDAQPEESGGFNQLIQRGYFDSFDPSTNVLKIKAVIPFTAQGKYYLLTTQLNQDQTVYCASEQIYNGQTNQYLAVKEITFPVKDGEIISIPEEKPIALADFISMTNQQSYLFVQLLDKPIMDGINHIQKIIILGQCN